MQCVADEVFRNDTLLSADNIADSLLLLLRRFAIKWMIIVVIRMMIKIVPLLCPLNSGTFFQWLCVWHCKICPWPQQTITRTMQGTAIAVAVTARTRTTITTTIRTTAPQHLLYTIVAWAEIHRDGLSRIEEHIAG